MYQLIVEWLRLQKFTERFNRVNKTTKLRYNDFIYTNSTFIWLIMYFGRIGCPQSKEKSVLGAWRYKFRDYFRLLFAQSDGIEWASWTLELDAITIYDAQLRRHTVRTYKSTQIDNMNLPLWEAILGWGVNDRIFYWHFVSLSLELFSSFLVVNVVLSLLTQVLITKSLYINVYKSLYVPVLKNYYPKIMS